MHSRTQLSRALAVSTSPPADGVEKNAFLLGLLGKAEAPEEVEAALVRYAQAMTSSLQRRLDVLSSQVRDAWKGKKLGAKSQSQANSTFQKKLTHNTIVEYTPQWILTGSCRVKEQAKAQDAERRDARKVADKAVKRDKREKREKKKESKRGKWISTSSS